MSAVSVIRINPAAIYGLFMNACPLFYATLGKSIQKKGALRNFHPPGRSARPGALNFGNSIRSDSPKFLTGSLGLRPESFERGQPASHGSLYISALSAEIYNLNSPRTLRLCGEMIPDFVFIRFRCYSSSLSFRCDLFSALRMALNDAVSILVSIPAPQNLRLFSSSIWI
jgi:hypothetical protein